MPRFCRILPVNSPTMLTMHPSNRQKEEPCALLRNSHKLDNVLYDVRGPVADEAVRMEAAGTHILKLNIGNPAPFGFRTPDEVVYDMSQQLPDTEGYSPSKGLFSARKAIMQYAQLKNIPQRVHRRHLHRQRRQRTYQPVLIRVAGQRRRGTRAVAGLSAVDSLCESGRRNRGALRLR